MLNLKDFLWGIATLEKISLATSGIKIKNVCDPKSFTANICFLVTKLLKLIVNFTVRY